MDIEINKELNNYITKYYNQIDNIYIDKFWSSINNKHWIYVDDVLIEWIGYKKDNGKFKYTNLIKENFKENIDYKTYNYDDINKIFHSPLEENENYKEILTFKDKLKEVHNRTLHLILSPKCFKKSLMMIRTERANSIRDYYVDIEEICLEFNKYLLENKNQEFENKNKELANKDLESKKKVEITLRDSFNKRCVVYLIKVKIDDEIIYKFGYTDDIVTRLRTHKNQISDDIELIYCIESKDNKILEKLLIDYLEQYKFRIKRTINDKQQTELLKVNDIEMIKNKLIELNNDVENEKLLIIKLKNKIIDLENENINLKQQLLLKDDEIVNKLKNKIAKLEKEILDYKLNETNENKQFIENKDIVTDRIHKKREVDKIDPTTLKIIETYECINSVITENPEYGYNSIYRSIKNNNVYKNFRWNYNGEKINPTNKIILEANKIERVIQLDKNKKFVKIYKTKSELCKLLHIGVVKLNKYIEEEKILNEFYYVNESSYNGNISDNEEYEIYNSKQIRETNIETNEIIIYKSMKELYEKRGIARCTLRKYIKNDKICGKYKWEYVNKI
jgi:hypothetical protein